MQTRKLHDTFNTLYYGVEMRRDDPPNTWAGTPRGQGNSRWAGGDGLIEPADKDEEMVTPTTRRLVKQKPPRELSLTPTLSITQVPAAIAVSVGTGAEQPAGQEGAGPDGATVFAMGFILGVATALGTHWFEPKLRSHTIIIHVYMSYSQ